MSPNPNDVLMGRGARPNEFIGNRRFRHIVKRREEAYKKAPTHLKTKIAREIVTEIHARGGRFLKQVQTDTPVIDVTGEGVWYEVEEEIALEKCRQAVRDIWKKQASSDGNGGRNHGREKVKSLERNVNGLATRPAPNLPQSSAGMVTVAPTSLGSAQRNSTPLPIPPLPLTHITSPWMLAQNKGPQFVDLDERRLLFRAAPFAFQEPVTLPRPMATNPVLHSQFNSSPQDQSGLRTPYAASMSLVSLQEQLANSVLSSQLHSAVPQTGYVSPQPGKNSSHLGAIWEAAEDQTDSSCTTTAFSPSTSQHDVTAAAFEVDMSGLDVTAAASEDDMSEVSAAAALEDDILRHDFSAAALEDDMSDVLLSSLFQDLPRFTEEQEEIERATMTDEEKAAALSDLFGRSCTVGIHKAKRAKLDLGTESIDFLVKHMRVELERIPQDEKRALVEAQTKCGEDEFSDARLERFLRCEGMNAKLGAQRFVNYWESRRELFGPEKFALRMTLSEALRDDLVAVEACLCRLLPHLDSSGRQLLFCEPYRHTREGYTLESMLRAVWYAFEVSAQANNDIRGGAVAIWWGKDSFIWDYDQGLYERVAYLSMSCLPVKVIARHICCLPWLMVKIIKPIYNAFNNKAARSRTVIHDVPESQLLDVLADYGILREILPTEMGGTVLLDQAEWMTNRMAVELGEI